MELETGDGELKFCRWNNWTPRPPWCVNKLYPPSQKTVKLYSLESFRDPWSGGIGRVLNQSRGWSKILHNEEDCKGASLLSLLRTEKAWGLLLRHWRSCSLEKLIRSSLAHSWPADTLPKCGGSHPTSPGYTQNFQIAYLNISYYRKFQTYPI